MSGGTRAGAGGLPMVHLRSTDGASANVYLHGAHVTAWRPARDGDDRLFLSERSEFRAGSAIRGGIPVIFPQFAGRGPLPKHGVARNRGWQVQPAPADAGDAALWRATLTDDAATREIWPHRFELTLTARAEGQRLETTLDVHNPGDVAWTFTGALHSYLTLGDPATVIHGLGGRTAEDNAADGRPTTLGDAAAELSATQPRDVAVVAASQPLTLDDPVLGALVLSAEGFGDRVVWNPGPGHGLADVPEGAEQHFVCIEPAALTAVEVKPATTWTGRQTLVAKPRDH